MLHIYFTDASQTTHTCFTYTSHTLSLYFTHIAHALQIYVQHSLTKLHLSLLHIALHHIDITLTSPDFTRMGRSKGEQEKKRHSGAHSCCQRSLTPIQAHSLPSACGAESCLLCCQPEPSLSRYLPDYHELLHDNLADCKLKGDELST